MLTPYDPSVTGPMPSGVTSVFQTGLVVGRYRLLEPLGGGPRGAVYLARHQVLQKEVVLRLVPATLAAGPRERFLADSRACAALDHPSIIPIEDLGRDEHGTIYVATPRARGKTLAELLEGGGVDTARALAILQQLASAVVTAHAADVTHGHLSPANVFVSEDETREPQVQLVDLGTGAVGPRDPRAAYTAPEQRRPAPEGDSPRSDPRSDVFSLGELAHALLAGRPPSDSSTHVGSAPGPAPEQAAEGSISTRHGPGDADTARAPVDALARWPVLAEVIETCRDADRLQRPPAATLLAELTDATERARDTQPPDTQPPDTLPPDAPWSPGLRAGDSSADELADLTGAMAGRYRLERLLGRGGIGSVWLAKHAELGAKAAVKVLHRSSARTRSRLLREARAVNLIDSPYILPMTHVGRMADGRDYALMDLLQGETLTRHLRRNGGRLPWAEVRPIAVQIAEALLLAHQAGVIHRDLKPDNVFVVEGEASAPAVRLLDFGIAELVDDAPRGTGQVKRHAIHGTPLYVAPEQALGEPCSPAADVYALGAVLYELLAGRPPFVGGQTEILVAKQKRDAPSLATVTTGLAPELVALIDRMLAIDPEQRPVSLQVLQALRSSTVQASIGREGEQDLDAPTIPAVAGATSARPPALPPSVTAVTALPALPAPGRGRRAERGRPATPLLLAIGAVIGAGSVLALLLLLRPAPPPSARPRPATVARPARAAQSTPRVEPLTPARRQAADSPAPAPPRAAAANAARPAGPSRDRRARGGLTKSEQEPPKAPARATPAQAASQPTSQPAGRPGAAGASGAIDATEAWADPFAGEGKDAEPR